MPRCKHPNRAITHGHKATPSLDERMHRARVTLARERNVIAETGEQGLELSRYRRANRDFITADAKTVAAIVRSKMGDKLGSFAL